MQRPGAPGAVGVGVGSWGRAGRATPGGLWTSLTDYWRFDEASGTRVPLVGTHNLAENGGSIGSVAGDAPFTGRNVANYAGTSTIWLDASITDAVPWSWIIWLKDSDPVSERTALGWLSQVARTGFLLTVSDAFDAFFGWMNSTGGLQSISFTTPNPTWTNWNMVYVSMSSSQAAVSVNGAVAVTGAAVGNNSYRPINYMTVGRANSDAGTSAFSGQVGTVARWSRILSNAEVAQLYNSGNGLFL